jgi:hypothetical protein
MDFYVDPYQENDGKISNYVGEDGLENPTNQQAKLNYENLCDL